MTNEKTGKVWAYLRVSTDDQDVANQKHGVMEYAVQRKLGITEMVEDSVSGRVAWRQRRLGEMLDRATAGDIVIFAEVSRIARSTLQVLEVLEFCLTNSVTVHIVKQGMVLDGSLQAKITATVLGLAAEIERDLISQRTTEALARRRAAGMPLGRPKGVAERVRLDSRTEDIAGWLKKKISKRAIAKLVDCAPSTLYAWLDRRGHHAPAATKKQ